MGAQNQRTDELVRPLCLGAGGRKWNAEFVRDGLGAVAEPVQLRLVRKWFCKFPQVFDQRQVALEDIDQAVMVVIPLLVEPDGHLERDDIVSAIHDISPGLAGVSNGARYSALCGGTAAKYAVDPENHSRLISKAQSVLVMFFDCVKSNVDASVGGSAGLNTTVSFVGKCIVVVGNLLKLHPRHHGWQVQSRRISLIEGDLSGNS
jgi:hypothetical protein